MPISEGHLEAKIDALTEKVDDMIAEQRQARIEQGKNNAELFRRVGNNEGEIKALQQSRPTYPQLIASVLGGASLIAALAQLIINQL